ncbi:MAG: prephenate dehydratase [Bacilli bacterium]
MKRIGYLGPEGTFTHYASELFFHEEDCLMSYRSIPSCMDALVQGEVDYAVVPLENALEGSVNITLDYLVHEAMVPIVGEIAIPIAQHLLMRPGTEKFMDCIQEVYSHPHALGQCHRFLHEHLPNSTIHTTDSTGEAARIVSLGSGTPISAAIANERAAQQYGLSVVARDIHGVHGNVTRFIILGKTPEPVHSYRFHADQHKSTLMITLPEDHPGALHSVLSVFAWRKINLTKIESRPMKTGIGNYFFIIDVDRSYDEVLLPAAKAELEALGCSVSLLGSYPAYGTLTPVNN